MDQGKVVLQGNYESLKQDEHFNSLLHKLEEHTLENKEEKFGDKEKELKLEEEKTQENPPETFATTLKESFSDFGSFNLIPTVISDVSIKKYENIIIEEDRKKGSLSLSTYMGYISMQGGWPFAVLILISTYLNCTKNIFFISYDMLVSESNGNQFVFIVLVWS